jgi:hypothetical protein
MERKTRIVYLFAAVADSFLLLWSSNHPLNEPSSRIEIALCMLAVALFAFAAGLVSRRPRVAHICAVAGAMGLPWLHTTTLRGNVYTNLWILFNVPDEERRFYGSPAMEKLAIAAAGLIVFAIAIGILRLLPARWGQRTWPAVAASFCFLAVWYSQSVMPYRIPGALDYSGSPMLQILHVQKHGLQFHETCIKVWGFRGLPQSSSVVVWNERRLFQYRFQQTSADVNIPQSVVERVTSLIESSKTVTSNRDAIRPLRGWDDEGWYVEGEKLAFQAYTKENQSTPPQDVGEFFQNVEKLPRRQVTTEDRKDVCLGFCYDPLSSLGALYANHRCGYEEASGDYVCR